MLYFAYGSNLSRSQMKKRCPGSKALGVAILRGYKFQINSRGYANVLATPGGRVYGLVWDLDDADLAALDKAEGVAQGLYRRESIAVERDTPVDAQVYIARDSDPGVPTPRYHRAVVDAARLLELPAPYLRELESWGQVKGE